MKPLAIDLFCGVGGWARGFTDAGYRVVGFDIDRRFATRYQAHGGEFVLADVRDLDGSRFKNAAAIVASPPCEQFSAVSWIYRRTRVVFPDMSCVAAAWRIRRESGVPTVIENVEGARRFWVEPAQTHRGPYWLWGDVPILPMLKIPPKEGGSRNPARRSFKTGRHRNSGSMKDRSEIPYVLARAVAEGMMP